MKIPACLDFKRALNHADIKIIILSKYHTIVTKNQ